MALQGKIFTKKTYTPILYKWAPIPTDKLAKSGTVKKPTFCNATRGSQGQDWITTYVYDQIIINGQVQRLAYVECDYVE